MAKKLADDISDVPGHLTEREVRYLVLLVACAPANGVILEIGSFMGKSTILLSRAAQLAGGDSTVVAVDPLTRPSETDPETPGETPSRESFYTNLKNAIAAANVEFHEMLSQELARDWSRPIRLLWIDDDHTWDGTLADFEHFAPNLPLGGLIALHDVMLPRASGRQSTGVIPPSWATASTKSTRRKPAFFPGRSALRWRP